MQRFNDTNAKRFMYSFWGLRQAFFERVSPELRARHGLELPDVFLLEYIGKSDLSPSEIADSMRLPAHAISRRLDGLEKRRLIRRSIDPDDARRRVLALTPAGQTLTQAALATLEVDVDEMLSVLGAARVEAMLGAMDDLAFGVPEAAPVNAPTGNHTDRSESPKITSADSSASQEETP